MKATKEQVEARVSDLLRIMLDGAESWDLCEYVREKEQEAGSCWHGGEDAKPLSYSQIRRYAANAEKQIAASCRASRKRLLRRHLAQRRNLYAKAVSQGDIRSALAVIKDEAELLHLYEFSSSSVPAIPPCKTAGDVTQLLAATIEEMRAGRLDTRKASTVGGLAGILLRGIETDVIDKRLEALAAVLKGRKEKTK